MSQLVKSDLTNLWRIPVKLTFFPTKKISLQSSGGLQQVIQLRDQAKFSFTMLKFLFCQIKEYNLWKLKFPLWIVRHVLVSGYLCGLIHCWVNSTFPLRKQRRNEGEPSGHRYWNIFKRKNYLISQIICMYLCGSFLRRHFFEGVWMMPWVNMTHTPLLWGHCICIPSARRNMLLVSYIKFSTFSFKSSLKGVVHHSMVYSWLPCSFTSCWSIWDPNFSPSLPTLLHLCFYLVPMLFIGTILSPLSLWLCIALSQISL